MIFKVKNSTLPVCEDRQFFQKPIGVAGNTDKAHTFYREFDSPIGYCVVFKINELL